MVQTLLRWSRADAPDASEALLSDSERSRLAALARPQDRALFRAAHVLVRVAVAEATGVAPSSVTLVQHCEHCGEAHGRPRVLVEGDPGPEVSLSHAADAVLAAVSDVPLGVDLEPWGGVRAGVERLALSAGEQALLAARPASERPDALLRWWVRKEAVVKAAGVGLRIDPQQVVVSAPWEPAQLLHGPAGLADFTVIDLQAIPGYGAALAIGAPGPPTLAVTMADLSQIS